MYRGFDIQYIHDTCPIQLRYICGAIRLRYTTDTCLIQLRYICGAIHLRYTADTSTIHVRARMLRRKRRAPRRVVPSVVQRGRNTVSHMYYACIGHVLRMYRSRMYCGAYYCCITICISYWTWWSGRQLFDTAIHLYRCRITLVLAPLHALSDTPA